MAKTGNVTNPGSGGATWAVDRDGSSRDHQYVKLAHGAEGVFNEAADATPVPVKVLGGLAATVVAAAVVNLAATATQLPSVACRRVRIKFTSQNGEAQLGPTGFTDAYPLTPGEKEVFELSNLNVLFAKADVAHSAENPRQLAYIAEV